jgi:hypothetical protein
MTRPRPERSQLGHVVLVVGVATLLAACGQAATPGVTPVATGSESTAEPVLGLTDADTVAYDQWQSVGPSSYRFTVAVQCFCPVAKPVEVTVRDGEVVSLKPEPPEFWSDAMVPIPELFQLVGSLRGSADVVDVSYDGALGYPTTIAVDRITEAVDDEVAYVVTDLTPLG